MPIKKIKDKDIAPTISKPVTKKTIRAKKPSSKKTPMKKIPKDKYFPNIKMPPIETKTAVTTPKTTIQKTLIVGVCALFIFLIGNLAVIWSTNAGIKKTLANKNINASVPSLTSLTKCSLVDSSLISKIENSEIDPATWQAIYNDLQSGDYQKYINAMVQKLNAASAKLQTLHNDAAAKKQVDLELTTCTIGTVQSLDKLTVGLWKAVDKYARDEQSNFYVDNLSDADVKAVLETIHKKLVDRNIADTDTSKHIDTNANSYEEMYLELKKELEATDPNSAKPNAIDYFPYKYAIITSDLYGKALPRDFSWRINAASAYISLSLVDPLLENTQSLAKTLNDTFYNEKYGDLQKKTDSYIYNYYNIPYSINTLDYAKKQVGGYVDYAKAKSSGQNPYATNEELGGARFERCESILYDKYIVKSWKEYIPITYTEATNQAVDLYKLMQEKYQNVQDKKDSLQSAYLIQALQYLYTAYSDPETGKIPAESRNEFASEVMKLLEAYKTKNPIVISQYLNNLFGYTASDEAYIMPKDIANQFLNVLAAFSNPQTVELVRTMINEALKDDGAISPEEMQKIVAAMTEAAKSSSPFVAKAADYANQKKSLIDAPYANNAADFGNYNACYFNGTKVQFTNAKPSYLPANPKYESNPIKLIRKTIADILYSRETLQPIIKSQSKDAAIVKAASKAEDLKAIMYISYAVVQKYLEAGNTLFNSDGTVNDAFMTGLLTELYKAMDGYNTPTLNALYQIKVGNKSMEDLIKTKLDTTQVDEYATLLLSNLVKYMEKQGYITPSKTGY